MITRRGTHEDLSESAPLAVQYLGQARQQDHDGAASQDILVKHMTAESQRISKKTEESNQRAGVPTQTKGGVEALR